MFGVADQNVEFTRLRKAYDAAFGELAAAVRAQQALAEEASSDLHTLAVAASQVERAKISLRERRDRLADFLLASRPQGTFTQLQEAAYFVWLDSGCPDGTEAANWFKAKERLAAAPHRAKCA